ncbi:MAG: glycine--tRNA ligase subunit beta [Desulforhopalus sp.]|nr:glycine--tRNA ligase subunit beta [Desulforhopalus sp.]
MPDLLFEIGTEEIPAGYIAPACRQLENDFRRMAQEMALEYGEVRVMATPRRLALIVADLIEQQADVEEELLGPSKKVAYDAEGNLSKAGMGFARSKGVDPTELQVIETDKGEYLTLKRTVRGRKTIELLPDILDALINALSFPKSMHWGIKRLTFARPLQWIVALFGEDAVKFDHEGIESSNTSMGHRFLANTSFPVTSALTYEAQLAERDVIVDPGKRRKMVLTEIHQAVAENSDFSNGHVQIDEELLDTVTNLVETPSGVCGTFDEKFLGLVPDVLITSMRVNQKYFPIVDDNGVLLPGFVAVNNTRVNNVDVTRKGHQRVLRARLEDALFFYDSDRESKLSDHVEQLSGIIFQAKLGTMLEKKNRLVKLSRLLAEKINPALVADCCRAAELCKADLLSDMVGEFPSLQGVMGADYAEHDGEPAGVALAIREHYMPKRAGAEIPSSDTGAILALADRFDTIAGCFGIGQIPTGSADPFALRRQSLAIIRIINEKGYRLSLEEIIAKALSLYGDKVDASSKTIDKTTAFIRDRFINDAVKEGSNAEAVEAAASVAFDDIVDCRERMDALSAMRSDESFAVLSASYKRIRNIIGKNSSSDVNTALLTEKEEKELYSFYEEAAVEMKKNVAVRDYTTALKAMLIMKEPVDRFFDVVMVMAEDEAVRTNRLNLLTGIGDLILLVGDISKFQK